MRIFRLLLGASCAAVALGGSAKAQSSGNAPVANAAQQDQTGELGDIVVTASRRTETIREVPTAISAFNNARLRDTQSASLADLVAITPNVQISSGQTNANITIRGVGNGNFIQAGGDPGVAVHKNGVYNGQTGLALSTFLDVDRVELLRGPQGTLFGRNATGGAINIIPNIPTSDLRYGVDVSAGVDPTLVRSSGYVSGPLDPAGRWTARVSAAQNYNRGFTRNLAGVGPSRLDTNNDFEVRGQLQWKPNDNLKVRLLAEYTKADDAGAAAFLLGTPTGGAVVFPDPINPIVVGPAIPRGDPDRRVAYANDGFRRYDVKDVDLTLDWSLGGGNLKLLGSYNASRNDNAQDGDGTAVAFTTSYFTNIADQWFAEAIYTSNPDKPFSYLLGANYYEETVDQNVVIPTSGYISFLPVFNEGGTVHTRSYGVFARAEYVLSPGTKVFGGMRYSHDEKRMTEFLNLRPIFTPGAATTNRDAKSWGRITYELGIKHDFSRSVTGYAKYATGYKSGGYSVGSFNPPFNPETNGSFETGLKGTFLNGALQANIAGFHMKYDNLQVNQVQGLISAVTNAAKATVYGVEVETIVRPTAHLRIEANGAWLHTRFDKFTTLDSSRPQLGLLDLTGNRLPNAPLLSAALGVFYEVPLSSGKVTPGVRYTWRDDLYFSEFNIPVSAQKAVGKFDLFLNYESEDRRWSASLFALNVADKAVKSNVVVVSALLGSLALGQYQPGRQVGASVGYRF